MSGNPADLVTARQTILRAISGDDADLHAAVRHINRFLQDSCTHEERTWESAPDINGRTLMTCRRCNLSWEKVDTTATV